MRILLVNKFWYPKGGSERYTFLLKDLLEANGHEVIPFAMEDERNFPSPWAEHFVTHVDFWEAADAVPNQTSFLQKLSRTMWSREAARRIGEVIDEAKPDIAHLQNFTHQISPSILPVLRKRGVPVVWTLHDLDTFRPGYRAPRAWGRRAFAWVEYVLHQRMLDVYRKHIKVIVAPSRFAAETARARGWRGRVEVIPNFVMSSPPTPPPKGKGGNEKQFLPLTSGGGGGGRGGGVLFVGRLVEEKGITDFVEAARRLPGIPFEVVGEGPLEESCKLQAASCKHVHWLGRLSEEETQRHIARAAIVVVPSTIPEIAPYVILEAMAAGVPVIASNIGGIPELVRDGETGILVPPQDPAALAKTIEMVYRDEVQRRRFGERARSIATAEYGSERHYERIIAVYTKLVHPL